MVESRILREELSARQQRILKTARIFYEEGKTLDVVAEENPDLPQHKTLRRYKNSEFWKEIKRLYSDRERFLLKREVEREIHRADIESKDWLSNAASMAESSRAYTQAAKARMDHAQKKVSILQEIGVYDKPGTKRPEQEEQEEEKTQVVFQMDEAVEEKMKEEAGQKIQDES